VNKSKSMAYDMGYIQAGVELLESYLMSSEVFWPLGENPPEGEPEYPRLTLDGLLLAKERLLAHPKPANQEEQVERVISELDGLRSRRRVAWENKAAQCQRVRLRMWADYLQEYKDNPTDHADRYAYEVRLRVMLALSAANTGLRNSAENQLLLNLDGYLKSVLVRTVFIWEAELQGGFPVEEYWYLYGKLPPVAK